MSRAHRSHRRSETLKSRVSVGSGISDATLTPKHSGASRATLATRASTRRGTQGGWGLSNLLGRSTSMVSKRAAGRKSTIRSARSTSTRSRSQEDEESVEDSEEASISDDSDHDYFTPDMLKPAGFVVEQINLPSTIKDRYSFLDLLHDSGHGCRVSLCIDLLSPLVVESRSKRSKAKAKEDHDSEKEPVAAQSTAQEPVVAQSKSQGKKQKAPRRRRCVLKVWQKGCRPHAEEKRWLEMQLKLLAMERHPNLVMPRKILEDEKAHYVEFDCVMVGCSLLTMIVSDASVKERQLKQLCRGILRGLSHLHKNGLVHGNLTPANILMEWRDAQALLMKNEKLPKGHLSSKRGIQHWRPAAQFKNSWSRHDLRAGPRIIDLDTVTAWSEDGVASSRRSSGGSDDQKHNHAAARREMLRGTAGFMAPEAYLGHAGPPGDLFSLGIVTYMIVRCEAPLHDSVLQILGNDRLEDADVERRREIMEATTAAIESISWSDAPWDQLALCRDFVSLLMHPNPLSRGMDASDILRSSPWFHKSVALSEEHREALAALANMESVTMVDRVPEYLSTHSTSRRRPGVHLVEREALSEVEDEESESEHDISEQYSASDT